MKDTFVKKLSDLKIGETYYLGIRPVIFLGPVKGLNSWVKIEAQDKALKEIGVAELDVPYSDLHFELPGEDEIKRVLGE